MQSQKIFLLILSGCLFYTAKAQTTPPNLSYRKPLFDFALDTPTLRLKGEQLVNKRRLLNFYLVSGYREGIKPITGFINFDSTIDYKNGTVRFYWINTSITDLLTRGSIRTNRLIFEVKDKSKYRYITAYGSKVDWARQNTYCLELFFAYGYTMQPKMIDDEISKIFHVRGGLEKRMINVWVLRRSSGKDKIRARKKSLVKIDLNKGQFYGVPMDSLVNHMFNTDTAIVFNETKYDGPIHIKFDKTAFTNQSSLIAALHHYDLDLREEKREIEMYVIHETLPNSPNN